MAKDIVQRISLDGADDIRRQFGDIARAGKDAFSQIEKAGAAGSLEKIGQSAQALGANLAKVGADGQKAGQQISESFSRAGSSIEGAGVASSGLGARIATGVAAAVLSLAALGLAANAAISKIVEAGATAATQLQESADKLGVTGEKLQQLRNQAETAGASFGAVENMLRRLGQGAAQASGPLAQSAQRFRDFTVATAEGTRTVRVWGAAAANAAGSVQTTVQQVGDATIRIMRFGEAAKASEKSLTGVAGELQKLGINLKQFATANADQQLQMLRQAFARLPDDTARAALAARLFGDNWREMLKVVSMTPDQIAAADKALQASGRSLTQSEIDNLTAYKEAKGELDAALQATRNRIAALFAPSKTRSVEWLTELIDANRQWLLDLANTKRAQFETFVSAFGAVKPFLTQMLKQAGDLARDLGKVLSTIVVPGVRLVQQAFEFAADRINQAFGTKLTGRFLAVAAAVASFTGVFGALRLLAGGVLAAFGLIAGALGSLRGAFVTGGLGAAAFWNELRLGAIAAFNAIRAQLPALRVAFAALLRGDVRTAWAIIQRQGVAAFEAIKKVVLDVRTPIGQMFQSLQTGFRLVMAALNGFAAVINAIFGTNLTGASLAFYTALLQVSGVLGTIIPIIAGLVLVLSRMSGGFIAVAAAVVVLLRLFPDLGKAWDSVVSAFDKLMSGDLLGAFESLQAAFAGFWDNLKQQSVATWAILGIGAVAGVGMIISAFAPLGPAIGFIWSLLTGLIGIFANIAVAAVTAFAGLLGVPAALVAAFAVAVGAIIVFWPQISAAALAAWEQIKSGASDLWKGVTELGQAAWAALIAGLKALWDSFTSHVMSGFQRISSFVSSIVDRVMSAVSSIASAISNAVSSVSGGGENDSEGFARGGSVRGRGTGTSDSILAWLSNGEFVMKAVAVRRYGVGLMQAINSGAFRMPAFANGGLAGAFAMPSMNFAPNFEAGAQRALAPVTLNIGGETISGLLAPEDVVGKLGRFASRKQTTSNGRKPSWYGN